MTGFLMRADHPDTSTVNADGVIYPVQQPWKAQTNNRFHRIHNRGCRWGRLPSTMVPDGYVL